MSEDTSGPAFPYEPSRSNFPGMTLRQWYAGLAMQGLVASGILTHVCPAGGARPANEREIREQAFAMADAMLREGES